MAPVSEIERTELVNQLVATIGEGPAETLMNCVLPDGRGQIATKDDLKEALKAYATKEDLKEALKAYATKEDLKAFATKEDLKAFATKEDLKALGAELRTEIAKQARVFFVTMTGFMFTVWGMMTAQFLM